jgi:ACS family tartrate transporter-like MFS transporter
LTLPLSSGTLHTAPDLGEHTRRRVAVRLLPFLFILYVVNYIDRSNLAYAALGMTRDLGFSDRVFGMGAGIFFLSYVALQIPGSQLVESWSARRMISTCMIAWGLLTTLMAVVQTPGQLYAVRFFLGAAEAGFFPGVVVYLSHWFLREDRAKASSNFMGAIPLSSVLGSPLAGWLLGRHWLGQAGWRWLFVLEGVPAILLGVAAFFFLTDWPAEASWLTGEQCAWLEQQLQRDSPIRARAITIGQALKSPYIRRLALFTFCAYFTFYCFLFWFPTMLKRQSGFSDMRVGLVGAIPFVATFIAMQINGWHSDKTGERRWHSAGPLFVAAAALLVLLVRPSSTVMMVVLFTVVCSSTAYLPIFWANVTETLSRAEGATAVGFINAVGNIAGFAGPYGFGYLYTRTGSFAYGLGLMMLGALGAGILILRVPARSKSLESSG